MSTPAEKRDLRQAWKHLDQAIREIQGILTPPEFQGPRLRASQEISNARRIIDRVEQGRAYGTIPTTAVEQIRAIHQELTNRLPRSDKAILQQLALDIHQALADAAASQSEYIGACTFAGPEMEKV